MGYHGVCYNTCDEDTGATCAFVRCSARRNAKCVKGKCVCDAGSCSFAGKCQSGLVAEAVMVLSEGDASLMNALPQTSVSAEDGLSSVLPELDDTMLLGLVAFFASFATASLVFMLWRSVGRSTDPIDTPLLNGAADEKVVG